MSVSKKASFDNGDDDDYGEIPVKPQKPQKGAPKVAAPIAAEADDEDGYDDDVVDTSYEPAARPERFDGPKIETILVTRDEADMRLDRWFRAKFPDVGQGYLQKLLRSGQVRVDSKRAQANDRLVAGQQIRVPFTVRQPAKRKPSLSTSSNLSDDDRYFIENMILFEDEHVLVLNKPFGLAVQGGSGTKRHLDGILAGMIERFGDRPRLVHRLDRDTTGVLLVAKTRGAAARLGRTFQTRSAAKTYWALVTGVPKPHQGRIEAALVKASGPDGDRVRKAEPGEQERAMHATTHYSMIDRVGQKMAWVSLKPVTGRQHQLRAHMSIIGHPIVGDSKYQPETHHGGGIEPGDDGIEQVLHLHARRLMLPHPFDEGRRIDVTAPLPEHMKRTWKMLGLDERRFEED